jgi:hypothetical protein
MLAISEIEEDLSYDTGARRNSKEGASPPSASDRNIK